MFWVPPPLLTSPAADVWVYGGSLCLCTVGMSILRPTQNVLDPYWLLFPGRVTVGCAWSIWPFGRRGTFAPVSKSSLRLLLCPNIEVCYLPIACSRMTVWDIRMPWLLGIGRWNQTHELRCVWPITSIPFFLCMLTMVWVCPESCRILCAVLSKWTLVLCPWRLHVNLGILKASSVDWSEAEKGDCVV